MAITTYAFQGAGKLSIKEYGAAAGLFPIGNCSQLELVVEEEVKKMEDYQDAAGGTAATSRRIKNVSLNLKLHELSPANLARATLGGIRTVAQSTVTDEAVTLYKGLNLLAHTHISAVSVKSVAASSKTVTLAQTSGTATATGTGLSFTAGQKVLIAGATPSAYNGEKTVLTGGSTTFTFAVPEATESPATGTITATLTTYYTPSDFEAQSGGLWIPDSGAIADDTDALVSYTHSGVDIVEALTAGSKIWQFYYEGMNVADSARSTPILIHKTQLGAAKNIAMIGNDLASLDLSGDVLRDNTITGTDLSKFFQIIQQAA